MSLKGQINKLATEAATGAIKDSNVQRTVQSTSTASGIGQVLSDPDGDGNVSVNLADGGIQTVIVGTQTITAGDVVTVISGRIV